MDVKERKAKEMRKKRKRNTKTAEALMRNL